MDPVSHASLRDGMSIEVLQASIGRIDCARPASRTESICEACERHDEDDVVAVVACLCNDAAVIQLAASVIFGRVPALRAAPALQGRSKMRDRQVGACLARLDRPPRQDHEFVAWSMDCWVTVQPAAARVPDHSREKS